ncbi:MAG: hypothetical protein A3F73_07430 [Gallionellales bacterium RIFCSPLOWO2_12_FULL_59_22]|nr:MAG: hypothetical protein A2Z65_08465 [Gallionellales bacterium RIFCSPLOWO2_02_58_13]OGT13168.1 MAG: hypothetical protein A3F73_07430 [Gallionellales bacterium RIFCSPLOWO2_12_FULL_59_22]
MSQKRANLAKALAWGAATVGCYAVLFMYADDLGRLAHTTTSSCMVGSGAEAMYYHKPTPELCAEKGGALLESNKLNVLVPIIIAFILSFVHGAFTGLFWDVVGLKAAKKK